MVKENNTRISILKLLLSNNKMEFTIRAISHHVAIDYKTVYGEVQELILANSILARKAGQATLCSINLKKFNADIFKTELARREGLLKNKNLSVLCSYFEEIKDPFFILLLFGSYASGKPRKGSDIDLLLITDHEKIKRTIQGKVSLIPLDSHFLAFTSEEFLSMLKTTEFNVGKEAFYNHIILFGIEDYYRLIQNA